MLDTTTKRRIDTARDILVGRVPDPKSQVEQITISLIYKFMDDMDREAEELGGKRKFFAGEFAKYGWANLMAPSVGGHELRDLYTEGIERIPQNPGIPALFRDIFKNAYLPFRDPETLRAFLKNIDEFTYDHSERLGDAFEYLLSVLGSQGDAGQFRTPRHIIDFIVSIVDPKKGEKVLDPACGTAGFLISSYKHILAANTDDKGQSTLSPEERGQLARDFTGYDISPDMVRLSLVNMYLHGLPAPQIEEYDTLTSQDKWNEYADVILANPPFMSPKGGIKPHNRFSVQSKRSEVLFVDYMAEHLSPTGRAGIIVPEGIIFQSQTAYKQLRKMLVEDYLVAVVSLPAGVFNPYSGVKTCILFLDRTLAKQSDTIAFFKVENDGFNLGAQRRAIDKNDLPLVAGELREYLKVPGSQQGVSEVKPSIGLIVTREEIAANADYNLGGERYRAAFGGTNHFPLVALGELATLIRGLTFSKADQLDAATDDSLLVATTKAAQESGIVEEDLYHVPQHLLKDDTKLLRSGDILISTANSLNLLGRTTHVRTASARMSFGAFMSVIRPNGAIMTDYLIRCLRTAYAADFFVRHANTTTNISNLNLSALAEFQIPLPPLDIQKEIVAEIEGYQRVIDGARTVVDNYRPHISIDPDWPTVLLSDIIEGKPKNGYSGSPVDRVTSLKVLSLSATTSGRMDLSKFKYLDEDLPQDSPARCRRNDIYLQRGNTAELVGTAAIFDSDECGFIFPDLMIRVRADESKIQSDFLLSALQSEPVRTYLKSNANGAAGSMPKINQSIVENIPVPLPPLPKQQSIVAEIEAEQALVAANRELITRFEQKIQATLARVWGEAAPAPPAS